jgi:hypothetical protein
MAASAFKLPAQRLAHDLAPGAVSPLITACASRTGSSISARVSRPAPPSDPLTFGPGHVRRR